jgi:hypothetical protein
LSEWRTIGVQKHRLCPLCIPICIAVNAKWLRRQVNLSILCYFSNACEQFVSRLLVRSEGGRISCDFLEVQALKRYVRQNSILSNIGKCHGKGISKQIPNAPGQAGGRHGKR